MVKRDWLEIFKSGRPLDKSDFLVWTLALSLILAGLMASTDNTPKPDFDSPKIEFKR